MKRLILIGLFAVISTSSYAFCLFNRGKDCPKNRHHADGNQTIIYNGGITGPPSISKSEGAQDGGFLRKRNSGDKSQNQGYADYREHFLNYTYEVYAVPHQEGFYKSSELNNRSVGYEYAFNPYISFKGQATELHFSGLKSKTEMKQEHLIGLLNLRIYILNDFVIRAGMGIGKSKVTSKSSQDEYKFKKEGDTEIIQFSANYLFGDENTFIGITATTIQGIVGETNLGSSSYGLNVGIGL